jgi:hypothetical protein
LAPPLPISPSVVNVWRSSIIENYAQYHIAIYQPEGNDPKCMLISTEWKACAYSRRIILFSACWRASWYAEEIFWQAAAWSDGEISNLKAEE